MRDSGGIRGGGDEDEEGDVGSPDGPSMRSMDPSNDNQPFAALHAEIAVSSGVPTASAGPGILS